ncbi:ATPase, T2SS/T4P/T4SS family [Marinicrinis sediminis]|uniref:ATPase, T2SS/T4P/T4SS family n=1 Tax=Marinicrinis sediminis TaxID=1652465 RepID=A0ABW5RCT1_9BACL
MSIRKHEEKFSPLEYARSLQIARQHGQNEQIAASQEQAVAVNPHDADATVAQRDPFAPSVPVRMPIKEEAFREIVEMVRAELVQAGNKTEDEKRIHTERLNQAVIGFAEARSYIFHCMEDILYTKRWTLSKQAQELYADQGLSEHVFAEVIGLSVLESVLKEKEDLEEIQVVGTRIYEVRKGVPSLSSYQFRHTDEVYRLQHNLVLYHNDRFSPRKRWAEVSFIDGSRVTMTGYGYTQQPTLTIRFYPLHRMRLETLMEPAYGTMSNEMYVLIQSCIQGYVNMIIIGATNTGKTHLMKAMIGEMNDEERIVTIEMRSELMLGRDYPHKNIVEYEVDEDDPAHDSAKAFKLALRQSPRRIIHAEIRDEDANIYVRACTRGHEGSMTTVHASALEDVPDVITDMCMLDGRVVNGDRMRKRVAEYVAQIGIEMGIREGKRKVIRIVEYGTGQEGIWTRALIAWNPRLAQWEQQSSLSPALQARMRPHLTKEQWQKLADHGWV